MIDPGTFSVGAILESKIETQGRELKAEIETQGRELRAEIETRSNRLEAEVKLQGQRVSNSELEQARLNGINSVLLAQTHTHEPHAD